MDEKRNHKKTVFIGFCLLASLVACNQKEKEKTKIIDDGNSQFAGKSCYGSAVENQYVLRWSDQSFTAFHGTRADLHSFIEKQQTSPNQKWIISAEQNRKFHLDGSIEHKLERFVSPALSPSSFWQVWGQEDMQVVDLWDKNIKGAGVVIAVIDGGVDQSHPSLINRIYVNDKEIPNNGIDDDQNGLVDDVRGFDFSSGKPQGVISDHGTHVAGIIAAEPKDSPMLGVAPESKILPISIFGGVYGGGLETAIMALKYAEIQGAKVVNASWGGDFCSESLREAILSLSEKDILFIDASGNRGADLALYPEYPAAFNLANQITVGASMPSGLMAAFSNYGYNLVQVLAPGEQILSTVSESSWGISSGTSMASPFVSGLAALLWSSHPESTMEQIKQAILRSIKEPQEYTPVVAKGRVNAVKALEQLELILKEPK